MSCQFSLLLLALALLAGAANADEGDSLWSRTYDSGNDDWANCVIQTSDGGYLLAGLTYPDGNYWLKDAYLVKTDSLGNVLWECIYPQDASNDARVAIQAFDGNYLLAGAITPSILGSSDMYLIKVSEVGDTLWSRVYGDSMSNYATSLIATSDGYYLIAGNSTVGGLEWWDSHMVLFKVDGNGDTLWSRVYWGSDDTEVCDVLENQDGDYLMAGWIGELYELQRTVYLVKVNSNGDTLWTSSYYSGSYATTIIQTSDGGYLLAGMQETGGGGLSMIAVKTDGEGNLLWADSYGNAHHNRPYDAIQTEDGGYLLVGVSGDFEMDIVNPYMVRTDSLGVELWEQTSSEDSSTFTYHSVIKNADGNYILAGGYWSLSMDTGDMYLLCMEGFGITPIDPTVQIQPTEFHLHPCHPNPFNPTTILTFDLPAAGLVKLEVFNIKGQRVGAGPPWRIPTRYPAGTHQIPFDGSGLPSGIYLARLTAGDFQQTQKLVLLK